MQTDAAILQLQRFKPACWTVENTSALFSHYRGLYATARTVQMRKHAALPSERLRLIISNQLLYFPESAEPAVTPHDVLAKDKGWGSEQRFMRQSMGSVRSTRAQGFTVTSSTLHIGAPTLGDFNHEYNASSVDRAMQVRSIL